MGAMDSIVRRWMLACGAPNEDAIPHDAATREEQAATEAYATLYDQLRESDEQANSFTGRQISKRVQTAQEAPATYDDVMGRRG